MRSFLAALAFLTILPIRFRTPLSETDLARSRYWYPLVGLLLGAFLGGSAYGLNQIAPPAITAFLILVLWVVVTGALHLDGVADTCDGLFGGRDPQERLQIMRDPHVGTFGILGLMLILAGKFVSLNAMAHWMSSFAFAIRLGICVLAARCMILVMAGFSRYGRTEGTGKFIINAAGPWGAFAAMVLVLGISWFVDMAAGAAVVLMVLLVTWMCRRRLGGATGDTLGLAVETAECTWLLACALTITSATP